jgi:hypothetical protein
MTNLTSELRPDINGKMVTRHVRTDKGSGAAGRAASLKGAAPSLGSSKKKASFKRNWSGFSFDDGYSDDYVPATFDKTVDDSGWSTKIDNVGSKYSGYQRTTEIAKSLREDLKEAVAAGYLPDGPRYGVKAGSAANTQDLSITVNGLPDAVIYDGMGKDIWGGDVRKVSAFTEELSVRLEIMVNAYNKESRNSGEDNSRNLYYGYIRVKDEEAVRWTEEQAAKKRRAREDAIQNNLG